MGVKTLVLYTGHGLEEGLERENTEFFLRHGLIDSDEIDFLFIFNCEEKEDNALVNIIMPNKNCKIIYRENKGYDFGAWSYGLSQVDTNSYDYFIFVNQSVKGPFLPNWHDETKRPWFRIFTDMIDNTTKLAGASINFCKGRAHVQSMMLVTDRVGLKIGLDNGVFDLEYLKSFSPSPGNQRRGLVHIVQRCEIGWSKAIIKAGYNIASTLSAYAGFDFRNCSWGVNNQHHLMANSDRQGDPCYNNRYFGLNINPVEAIFIKTNRGMSVKEIFCHTIWMDRRYHNYGK